MDSRYRWESEVATWPPKSTRPLTLSRTVEGSSQDGQLDLKGADAGEIQIRVYDIQGRVVLEQVGRAGGTGTDTVRIDLGDRANDLPNGIYFASVRDTSGRTTNPLKLVLLR